MITSSLSAFIYDCSSAFVILSLRYSYLYVANCFLAIFPIFMTPASSGCSSSIQTSNSLTVWKRGSSWSDYNRFKTSVYLDNSLLTYSSFLWNSSGSISAGSYSSMFPAAVFLVLLLRSEVLFALRFATDSACFFKTCIYSTNFFVFSSYFDISCFSFSWAFSCAFSLSSASLIRSSNSSPSRSDSYC